jgi:Ca-activated chloride channel homolog
MRRPTLFVFVLATILGCSGHRKFQGQAPKAEQFAGEVASTGSTMADPDPSPAPKLAQNMDKSSDLGQEKDVDEALATVKKRKRAGRKKRKTRAHGGSLTKTLYLSADDSNSQASPIVVRNRIRQGRMVDPSLVRTYEFLNYYTFLYAPAKKDRVVIYPEMRPGSKAGEYSMQIAVRSEDRARREVLPLNFTLLIDISGSMAGRPMELIKDFVSQFLGVMKKGDRLSVVVCNRQSQIIVNSFIYDKTKLSTLEETIKAALKPNDVTDLHSGIKRAYKLAEQNYGQEFLNRVVLLSDGATNAGDLAIQSISKYSKDSEGRGIYLVGVGFGEGFNDSLMDAVTDAGKGAYFFVTSKLDIEKALVRDFAANFDIAVKDVRLKMIMPASWSMVKFHGEQVSSRKSEVIPQHLAPNDQMIYHQVMKVNQERIADQDFIFEAEFRDVLSNKLRSVKCQIKVKDMLRSASRQIAKGDAICAYAEMFKKIQRPLDLNRKANLKALDQASSEFNKAAAKGPDEELESIAALMNKYRRILDQGEIFPNSLDKDSDSIGDVLGIRQSDIKKVKVWGAKPALAIKTFKRLNNSTQLSPREGYRFLVISTGPAGATQTKGRGKLSGSRFKDPVPEFMGFNPLRKSSAPRIHDVHQVTLTLEAPRWARSFSFDFNFFSAEYPEYVNKNFNDTFYAILEAHSTNDGQRTNIAFDSSGQSIEVDNNYFQNPYHPISNRGTGFGNGGSTSWLRTSWPIRGGERFKLTFSVHDEGDEVYDSAVVLDHFKFHKHKSVGNTDPLN